MPLPLSEATRAARRRRNYLRHKMRAEMRRAERHLNEVVERAAKDPLFEALVRYRLLELAEAAGV